MAGSHLRMFRHAHLPARPWAGGGKGLIWLKGVQQGDNRAHQAPHKLRPLHVIPSHPYWPRKSKHLPPVTAVLSPGWS